jgi:hypothetical protein
MGAIDGAFSRIVGREGQVEITIISFEQSLQIRNTGFDVLLRRVKVAHSKTLRGCGHQLHEPNSALAGECGRIPVALGLDHGANQRGIDVMAVGGFVDHALDAVAIDGYSWAIGLPQE